MTMKTNVENIRQCKSTFSFTAEQTLDFAPSSNLVREVRNLPPNFKRIA